MESLRRGCGVVCTTTWKHLAIFD